MIVRTMGKLYAATGKDSYRKCGRAVLERYGRVKGYFAGGNVVEHEQRSDIQRLSDFLLQFMNTRVFRSLQASRAGWEMIASARWTGRRTATENDL